MRWLKSSYRIARSILFTAVILVAVLFVSLYVTLSIPSVQDEIRSQAEAELSGLLGGDVRIGRLSIHPFNEVVLSDVTLADPEGRKCLEASRLGTGISIWRLVMRQRIEITYVELLDFNVALWKETAETPLNIDFIIKALSPKDKSKPPTKFDLRIRNIVLRGGKFSFSRLWMPRNPDTTRIDFNHIRINGLRADVALPVLRDDSVVVDLRRLAFKEGERLEIIKIAGLFSISPHSLGFRGLGIELPGTTLNPSDFSISFDKIGNIRRALSTGNHHLVMVGNKVTPSDFAGLYPPLSHIYTPMTLDLSVNGNLGSVVLEEFRLTDFDRRLDVSLTGRAEDLPHPSEMRIEVGRLLFSAGKDYVEYLEALLPASAEKGVATISRLGAVEGLVSGAFDMREKSGEAEGYLSTGVGRLDFDAEASFPAKGVCSVSGKAFTDGIQAGHILDRTDLGLVAFDVNADLRVGQGTALAGLSGNADISLPLLELNGRSYSDIALHASKNGHEVEMQLTSDNEGISADIDAYGWLEGASSRWRLTADVEDFNTAILSHSSPSYAIKGNVSLDAVGNTPDNIAGTLRLGGLSVVNPEGRQLEMPRMVVTSEIFPGDSLPMRHIQVNSELLNASVAGDFLPSQIPGLVRHALSASFPSLLPPPPPRGFDGSGSYKLTLSRNSALTEFFRLPVTMLSDIVVEGEINGRERALSVKTSVPYLQQGRDKLIRDIYLEGRLDGTQEGAALTCGAIYPTKKGDLKLDVSFSSQNDMMKLDLDFNRNLSSSFYGYLSLGASLRRDPVDRMPEGEIHIYPSSFVLNGAEWKMGEADITYADNRLEISGVSLRHAGQFVLINGNASSDPEDTLSLSLADIDLSYIFDTLNINYVTFGGIATGDIEARNLFTASPEAYTKTLIVKNLAYNGAVLGDGVLSSSFDAKRRRIAIGASVEEDSRHVADINGGIWLGRDSLSFDIDADKIDIRFLQPFMQAFSSRVTGRASGKAKLFGTFKDIDLYGRLYADSIDMLVDYTNVSYHGSDSVIIDPGHIRIPSFRIYDKYGNSGVLSGEVTHNFFHDPSFRFTVTGVRHMLCYDTNSRMNPDWYGTVFASGTARLSGRPGRVDLFADMATDKNTTFTFVLSDEQQASDYNFLTFSDRRKAERPADIPIDDTPDFLKLFNRTVAQEQGPPSIFALDLRVSATPEAKMVIVMDPAGGDRITAYGSGAMNITYSSEDDEMKMYGKYVLERGTYNFTLQDIILKDFVIKPGSEISFTGDPMRGVLDIAAAYRVNTSLTDLDKSFATDRELNRTNVPVEAILKARGVMTNPEISFDIELPTVTEETQRKVKSIISTEDLMSRQVIYLLALNRFYTPEYMGSTSNGGEWASVASSTLSSQLQNVLGQLTDKFTLAPSLRSDKGDFSDLEVDVALSSTLLNNRLLLNGNFGYRDRSTSNTTFVGDFDIEYLLNRSGNLRLKAYNHFNDQNYYLKSALTTQGIGIVYRRDFDNPFTFLKRRKRKETAPADSTATK